MRRLLWEGRLSSLSSAPQSGPVVPSACFSCIRARRRGGVGRQESWPHCRSSEQECGVGVLQRHGRKGT